MKAPGQLPASYMQNMHNLMRNSHCHDPLGEKKPATQRAPASLRIRGGQAMNTAMNANRKINTAPATGNTMGIMGTMDSTTSCGSSLCCCWGAWDMITPDKI
jgi:hypothetical protein